MLARPETKPALLSVRNLSVAFGSMAAVTDFSFDVREGETLAIVGESGCGKSTTALSILQLLPPHASCTGEILFESDDILRMKKRELRALRGGAISMIFQEPMTSLNPVLTVGRQITEVLRKHQSLDARQARTRAIELLDLVRIPHPEKRFDEYPHRLSGGMRQRIMIAMAVACNPRILVADEPTTALDVTIQAQILELLDRLRRDLNMGLLLITHDLGIVNDWADRVIVMYAGRKCEEASTERFFRDPRHPYTRRLMAASPNMIDPEYHYRDGPLSEIPGSLNSALGETGCPFAPRCSMVEARCRAGMPPFREIAAGHKIACVHHGQ
ncbi:MAG: ABC transporter ATP-binding protein [Reyranellaceae bacterium]